MSFFHFFAFLSLFRIWFFGGVSVFAVWPVSIRISYGF